MSGADPRPACPAVSRRWLHAAGLAAVATVAAVVRGVAVARVSFQVDEPFSLLGARMVADRGLPVLPSGTVYLHGATLSYLLAPLVASGHGGISHLQPLRTIVAITGVVAVLLAYGLAAELTGSTAAALLAGIALALDPLSVEWAVHVRMYVPFQALTLGLAWLVVRIVARGPTRRQVAGLVALFWFALFTHAAAVLLLAAIAAVAVTVHGRGLAGPARTLGVGLVCCALAPPLFVGLGRLGPENQGAAKPGAHVSFVGDHLVEFDRVLEPDLTLWRSLFGRGVLHELMPVLVVLASGLLLGTLLVGGGAPETRARRRGWGTLLALYWLPVAIAVAFTAEPQPRYLLFVHPLGLLLLTGAAAELARRGRGGRAAATLLALLTLLHAGSGLSGLYDDPVVDADYVAAAAYVADRVAAGEPVVLALPAVGYFALPPGTDARFLAGPAGSDRVRRYTIARPDGHLVDRWVGEAAIASTSELCRLLRERPESWLVVDWGRIRAPWAYGGPMGDVLAGATRVVFAADGGAVALRPKPPRAWSVPAQAACRGNG